MMIFDGHVLHMFGILHFEWFHEKLLSIPAKTISQAKTIYHHPLSYLSEQHVLFCTINGNRALEKLIFDTLRVCFPFQSFLDIYVKGNYNLHFETVLEMLVTHIGI